MEELRPVENPRGKPHLGGRSMKEKGIVIVALFVMITVASTPAAFAENDKKPIVLNWLSFSAKASVTVRNLQHVFIDRVNERANGELVINYRG
jgi:hypothetical protein